MWWRARPPISASCAPAIAVRAGDPLPPIGDAAALRAALLAADAIYFPDPEAGDRRHPFRQGARRGSASAATWSRALRPYPNGATAMRALAAARGARPIGCTQVTEILSTPGVALVGALPKQFELATVYTAGVGARAALPDQARRLAALLSGETSRAERDRVGFEALFFSLSPSSFMMGRGSVRGGHIRARLCPSP